MPEEKEQKGYGVTGGIWIKKSNKVGDFLSGTITFTKKELKEILNNDMKFRFVAFRLEDPTSERSPDFRLQKSKPMVNKNKSDKISNF